MGMVIKIIPETGFLHVVASGEFSLEEAKWTFRKVIDVVSEHKSEKVLFDGRELIGKPDFIERFYYGEFVAHCSQKCVAQIHNISLETGARGPRFAYVLKEPVLDPGRFGETVARNRGMIVKAFDNPDDALGWLEADKV